jgi:hypothetical protein
MKKHLVSILAILMVIFNFMTIPAKADSFVTVSTAWPSLLDRNVRIDSANGASNVSVAEFRIKSEGGTSTITEVGIQLHGLGNLPTTLRVYEGATLLASRSVVTYTNVIQLSTNILSDTAKTISIKADFPSTTTGWSQASIISIESQSQEGVLSSITPEMRGPEIHFFENVSEWELASTPLVSVQSDLDGWTQSMTATFTFNVTAIGGTMLQPQTDDVVIVARTNPYDEVLCTTDSVITMPNGNIADGSTSQVTVTATLTPSMISKSGEVGFLVKQINWGHTLTTKVQQQYGLDNFKTPGTYRFTKNGSVPMIPIRLKEIGQNLYDAITVWKYSGEYNVIGQVVGEGQPLLYSWTDISPVKIIVFPNGSVNNGQAMTVDVAISPVDMTPTVRAPANTLGEPINFVVYPISNRLETVESGVITKVTFDVNLDGFIGHGKITRTGTNSCIAVMYWGAYSTYDNPGSEIDLENLSPGKGIPEKGYSPVPPRFTFKLKDITFDSQNGIYRMPVKALPFSFRLEGSSDLIHWIPISYGYGHTPSSADSDGSEDGFVDVSQQTFDYFPSLDPRRVFFRISLNQ